MDVGLTSEVSVAELAEVVEAANRTEQEGIEVIVSVTVIIQEAGQVRGHAAANGQNAMTASAHVPIGGDIIVGRSGY